MVRVMVTVKWGPSDTGFVGSRPNFARKLLPHRLLYAAINNITFVVKTPYNYYVCREKLKAALKLLYGAIVHAVVLWYGCRTS